MATIDKCFADDYSKFIVVDDLDQAIQQLDGKNFVVLHEGHFSIYGPIHKDLKCHCQSRNIIMTHGDWSLVKPLESIYSLWIMYDKVKEIGHQYNYRIINDLLTYDEALLLYFISYKDKDKGLFDLNQHRNSIVEYFDELNMEKFSEILKSKKNVGKEGDFWTSV